MRRHRRAVSSPSPRNKAYSTSDRHHSRTRPASSRTRTNHRNNSYSTRTQLNHCTRRALICNLSTTAITHLPVLALKRAAKKRTILTWTRILIRTTEAFANLVLSRTLVVACPTCCPKTVTTATRATAGVVRAPTITNQLKTSFLPAKVDSEQYTLKRPTIHWMNSIE